LRLSEPTAHSAGVWTSISVRVSLSRSDPLGDPLGGFAEELIRVFGLVRQG
jgi:hypothetical protein